jgi:hypothetical protein
MVGHDCAITAEATDCDLPLGLAGGRKRKTQSVVWAEFETAPRCAHLATGAFTRPAQEQWNRLDGVTSISGGTIGREVCPVIRVITGSKRN